jgi:galactokinase/mevalonate kinase-like predicted kinase
VPLYAHVTLEPSDALELRARGETIRIESVDDLELRNDLFDVARAALRAVDARAPVRIVYGSDIPLQSGLGGSTALLVALLRGLLERQERSLDPYELAELSRKTEWEVLGVTCGWVDHYLCTFGGLQYVDLRGKEAFRPVADQPFASLEDLGPRVSRLPFVLAFTGIQHDSGSVHAPAWKRLERRDPEVTAAHTRMGEIGREGRAALLAQDWKQLGALMNENHEIQRGLGGSGEANDRLIESALEAGAPGAKLAGAGHGGTIVALWHDDDRAKLESALTRAGATVLPSPTPLPGVSLGDVPHNSHSGTL